MITVGETFSSDEFVLTLDDEGTLGSGVVTVVVTLPDGVTTESPPAENPELGVYRFDYLTTTTGRHEYIVTATGGDLGSTVVKLGEDVFHVDDSSTAVALVGLAEAKAHLQIPASRTGDDEELRGVIVAASELVEQESRLWHRATVVERLAPSAVLWLDKQPVVSVTSVEQGATAFTTGWRVTPEGALAAAYGWSWPPWAHTASVDDVVVTYEAGETVVPTPVREAVLDTVEAMWRSQRGPVRSPLRGSSGYEDEDAEPDAGDPLPYGARKKIEPWAKGPVVA